jgi:hypothetical protein
VDVRIGVTQAPRELVLARAHDADREAVKAQIDAVLADDDRVLWLTDRKGRSVGVPAKKIAYVELGAPDSERRIGFGG